MENLSLALRTGPLHCSADWSKTSHRVWFPAMSAVLWDREAGMPNLRTQWCVEWLQCIPSPLWARPSFGVNWDSSLASSEAIADLHQLRICLLVFQSRESRPPPYPRCVVWTVGWTLQHSPRRGTSSSKKGSGQALSGVWTALASQEWGPITLPYGTITPGLVAGPPHILAPWRLMWLGTPALLPLGTCGLGSCDLQK